ncbi:unnamed protein product [Penicillium salamii]|nr:unnamed protein product [Penicillium salamii]CAG8393706.1 unnamed protein product [Penicillium salamii]
MLVYFLGNTWAQLFPDTSKVENWWKTRGGRGKTPKWISALQFLNPGPFRLKEHAIIVICCSATGDDNGATMLFAAQRLFYDLPLNATTIVLSLISIGLFGYGVCGFLRPICVWHPEAVYWANLPIVKTLQDLHWDRYQDSRQLRYFWYTLGGMAIYQVIPGYMFPWLNAVSIPCLASQNATGYKASVLTNLFGGATTNEGLGMFSLCFDWQYIGGTSLAFPLKLQLHQFIGIGLCSLVMLAIYYGNAWDSRSLPFMSTVLRTDSGKVYPSRAIFPGGRLGASLLEKYGTPRLTGGFAYGLLMANAAVSSFAGTLLYSLTYILGWQIGALFVHVVLFLGKDIWRSYRQSWKGQYADPHHTYMAQNYKDTPLWWYAIIMVFSFVIGLVVVIKEDITLPLWAYVIALLFGIIVSFFSMIIFSRFGNGIATNNLSKMIAGLIIPGRPVGNMYFALWSHNVITSVGDLCASLKMGDYFLAMYIYGCMLGAAVNYAVMDYITRSKRDLLITGNGDSFWSH